MILLTRAREARCDYCAKVKWGYDFHYTPHGSQQFRCLKCLFTRLWDCLLALQAMNH